MTAVPLPYTCGAFVTFYHLRKVPTFVLVRKHGSSAMRAGLTLTRSTTLPSTIFLLRPNQVQ